MHSWHNVNQFTPTTIHHNVLSETVFSTIHQKLCQYKHHRASNTNRAELIENALMVDPIKGYPEINL